MKNFLFKSIITLTSITLLISCFYLFYNIGKISNNSKHIIATAKDSAKIKIHVIEQNTGKPIDGATVCIIETRHYENTNKYGYTNLINVPIIRNTNFDMSHSRNWGELTILVYKNGYSDNITFYTSVIPNSTKVGVVIQLAPIISSEDNSPDISVESPNYSWTKQLIKLYKKRI